MTKQKLLLIACLLALGGVARAQRLPAVELDIPYRTGDEATRASAIDQTRALGLGRFAEPAMRRLCLADPTNRDFSNAAWQLLYAAFTPKAAAPATAAR